MRVTCRRKRDVRVERYDRVEERRACADGGTSRGSIVGAVRPARPVRVHELGPDRVERLHRTAAAAAGLVTFVHDILGITCIEPAVLASRTERYRFWVRADAAERGIPVLPAPKGERKED